MAKRARTEEAPKGKKQADKIAKAMPKYELELEIFIRMRLKQNVVFGNKHGDEHARISYHSEDEHQKENRKVVDLFQDLLPFPVLLNGWKGGISVYFYRPEDTRPLYTQWEFEPPYSGGEPCNKKWFYKYQTNGEGTIYFLIELIRISQELFYLSRFGGKFTRHAEKAYPCLQEKEKTSQHAEE